MTVALSPKQQLFVVEYLKDLNATQAAIRAGYSPKTARVIGQENLLKPAIQAAVEAAKTKQLARLEIKADDILRELLLVARSDIGHVLDFSGETVKLRKANEIPEAARRAMQAVKAKKVFEGTGEAAMQVEVMEFKLWDKLSALEKIGKHLGLFKDEIDVNLKGQIVTKYYGFNPYTRNTKPGQQPG